MAKINPIKTRQEAEKAEKAGKLDQAIPLYRMLVEDNPRDWNTINKIGDLFAKIGKMKEASVEYGKVADFYAKDGFHLKAIAIWKKINKLDPAAIEPYSQLADLYSKQGLMTEAKSQYQVVAEDCLKKGRNREAGEVLRKLVDLDPTDLKTRSRLADIYQREGSADKAVKEYAAIAQELHLKGHPAEAIQVLEKGLKIDPGSTMKAELGRVHLAQKAFDKAIAYFEEVTASDTSPEGLLALGQAYLGARRVSDAQTTLESVLKRAPDNHDGRVLLVQVYAAQGRADDAYEAVVPMVEQMLLKKDIDRAHTLLSQITARSPQHVRTLQKLVEVARVRQNERAIVQALGQLLEAHEAAGALRAAQDTAQQLVDVEPANEQFKAKLESLRGKKSDSGVQGPSKVSSAKFIAPTASVSLPPPTASVAEDDLGGMEFATGGILRPADAVASAPTDKEFVNEHLAEARVFRKYGLVDKAEEQVDMVLARFPGLFDARLERKEIFKETQRIQEAAKECVWLAQDLKARGEDDAAQKYLDEADELVPGSAAAATAAPAASEEEDLGMSADAAPSIEVGVTPEAAGEAEEDLSLDMPAEAAAAEPSLDISTEAAPSVAAEEPPAADAEAELDLGAPEPAPPPAPAPPPPPPAPEPEPEPAMELGMPEPPAPAAPAAPAIDPELARIVEEIDSYVSLGFVDDAKDALKDAFAKFPDDEMLLERARSLGYDPNAAVEEPPAPAPAPAPSPASRPAAPAPPPKAPPPAAPAEEEDAFAFLAGAAPPEPVVTPPGMKTGVADAPPPEAGGIDLGAELSALFDAQPAVAEEPALVEAPLKTSEEPGLQDIFNEFKKGVDQALGSEDYDTRYNLGIAYKEMGLIDEAIAEFQLAAKDPKRALECSSMIGICFLEKGVPDVAIQWFEKGLKVAGRAPEEYRGLKYDLASAWEQNGDAGIARQIFTELYAEDAGFRDVSERLRSLKGK